MQTPAGAEPEPPRINRLRIRGYRSIDDWVDIRFPTGVPLVLLGENNAGKSNVLRALALLLGETWPGNYLPDDHEFYGRSPEGQEIVIDAKPVGLDCPKCNSPIDSISWRFDPDADRPCRYEYHAACSHTYMNNDLKAQLMCLTIGVDRSLEYQLSYRSKWTTLSKLMRRFHGQLVADPTRVERLKTFYEGLVQTFHEVEEFGSFAATLRTATGNFGGNLPYGLDIDFSAYDPSNFFRSLRVFPQLDGQARSYDEFGTGQEQILAMAFTYAYATAFGGGGLILAVEEPEAHLHPLAQEWIARKLTELAEAGAQVIVTTHSPAFVNLARPGTTVLLRKLTEQAATTCVQLDPSKLAKRLVAYGAPETLDPRTIGSTYENLATTDIKAALFARRCILVEGPTEQAALPEMFRRAGVDLVKEGVAIVGVGGIVNMPKWIRYFRAHEVPVYPIFDTDSTKSDRGGERRRTRSEIFGALGLNVENDWDALVSGPVGTNEQFAVFDPDYEGAMRTTFGPSYEALEATARENVGTAKPLVARFVARNLAPLKEGQSQPLGTLAATAVNAASPDDK